MRNHKYLIIAPSLLLAAFLMRPSPYRYRFPITGGPDLAAHLADLEARVKARPTEAIEKASLAGMLATAAKLRGDVALYDRAESLAKQSLASLPFSNTSAKITLARVAEARHDFRRSIALAKEIADEGKLGEALSLLATCHLATGEIGLARLEATRLVEIKPYLGSHALLGLALAAAGDDKSAEAAFARGIAVEDGGDEETSAWTRALLARHLLKNGRISGARDLLNEALRIVPDYHFAHDLLGQLALQRRDYAGAAKEFGAAFAASKQIVYLRHEAHALKLKGNAEAADALRAQAERALRAEIAEGGYGHRLELAGMLLEGTAETEHREAARLAREEWANRPAAETGYVLARALLLTGETREASAIISRVLTTGARDARYFTACAEINRASGDAKAAGRCADDAESTNREIARLALEKKAL